MKTELQDRTDIEGVREKNAKASASAYENIRSVTEDKRHLDGLNSVLSFFHEKLRVDASLSTAEQLEIIKSKCGIGLRSVELEQGWYNTVLLPMIADTVDGKRLVILPSGNGGCLYIENRRMIHISDKNADMFKPQAVCLCKGFKNGPVSMRDVLAFLAESIYGKRLVNIITVSVTATVAGLALPWITRFIFESIIPSSQPVRSIFGAFVLSVIGIQVILQFTRSLVLNNSVQESNAYIQSAIYSRLMSVSPGFFKKIKSGELVRMVMEFSDITRFVSARSIGSVICMLLSPLYLIQINRYEPEATLWVITVSLIITGLSVIEGVFSMKLAKRRTEAVADMSGFCYEIFSAMDQIKLCGAESRIMKRWSEKYLNLSKCEDVPFFIRHMPAIRKTVSVIAAVGIFIIGAGLESFLYIPLYAAYGAFIGAIVGASDGVKSILSFASSYSLIKPLLLAECEEYEEGKKHITKIDGNISIADLRFRYEENMPYVIDSISLDINKNESVGIVGSSGSGKSTLIRLLLGFETAETGSVSVDGTDLREIDLKSYRRLIGVVLQDGGLISGSIYSNITMTKPDATLEEAERAAQLAGFSEDLQDMPMGLHTPVNNVNCTLSGGQVQRILIARAIISDPSLIIFDEATSSLDNVTQAKITQTVDSLKCTKIIVAHRLSTIKQCDRIIVIDKGKIVQEGKYDELINTDGHFRDLALKQLI